MFADPAHFLEGPGPNRATDVAFSLDRGAVYYSEGPEPACGAVSEVAAVTGAVAESQGDGNHVAPGPAGHYVTSGGCGVRIRKGSTVVTSVETPPGSLFGSAAWSADGRRIAVDRRDGNDPALIVLFDLGSGGMSEIRDPDGLGYRLPAFRNDGRLVVVQQRAGGGPAAAKVLERDGAVVGSFSYGGAVADQAYDATHTWLLVTMVDGRVRWFGGGEQGDLGTGYTAADW
jgi:hypothetical protein